MNTQAHANILTGAFHVLPEYIREQLACDSQLLYLAGNYPDYFDDPTRPADQKTAIDPDWKRYCLFPDYLKAQAMHFWPGHISDQYSRIPMLDYLLQQMVECARRHDNVAFIKFSGCISHYFGDVTQPAHLNPESDLNFIQDMLPCPDDPYFANFHYHTSIEAVTGTCGILNTPELQGTGTLEAAWRLSRRCRSAVAYCRRFIVPIAQALFSRNLPAAELAASEPVTIAAQLTADAIFTAIAIAQNTFDENALKALEFIDLRILPPDHQFHDMVYSGAIIDGNKNVPPNDAPVVPGKLRFANGVHNVKGIGVLPHSGMSGPRECSMSWKLPSGVFGHFSATVGLHSELADTGAVSFHVLLDGKELWHSGQMTSDDVAKTINVNIGYSSELTLLVKDANQGKSFWKNHAFWADPMINK